MAYPEVPDQTYSYTGFSQSLGDGSFPGPASGGTGVVIIEW